MTFKRTFKKLPKKQGASHLPSVRINKGLVFLAPHFFGLSLVYLLPFGLSLWLSLQKSPLHFRGLTLKHYVAVIQNDAFQMAYQNNLIFMALALPLVMVLAFLMSYWLWELKASHWLVLAFVVPICLPSASVIGFFRGIFGAGYGNLMDSQWAMVGVLIIFLWKNTGYGILIFMSGLGQIAPSLYENTRIDGASRWQILGYITAPELVPTAAFAFVVSVLNSYKVFKDIYLLQGSYPNLKIYMLQNYMNNKAVKFDVAELAAASNLFLAVVLLVIGAVHMTLVVRRLSQDKNSRIQSGEVPS